MFNTRKLRTLAAAAIICPLAIAGLSMADDPVTWNFDESTSGGDVLWTSPTAVRPDAAVFEGAYELTGIWVTVLL